MLQTLANIPWYGWLALALIVTFAFVFQALPTLRALVTSAGEKSDWFALDPHSTISAADFRALGIGAILAERNSLPLNTLATGHSKSDVVDGLGQAWETRSRIDAHATLQWLLSEGHRVAFEELARCIDFSGQAMHSNLPRAAFGSEDNWTRALSYHGHLSSAWESLGELSFVDLDNDLARGIGAWDYGRAVLVARWCYEAEYITEAEAWNVIRNAADAAKHEYSSWREFAAGYALGRVAWNGADDEDFELTTRVIEALLNRPGSPWLELEW